MSVALLNMDKLMAFRSRDDVTAPEHKAPHSNGVPAWQKPEDPAGAPAVLIERRTVSMTSVPGRVNRDHTADGVLNDATRMMYDAFSPILDVCSALVAYGAGNHCETKIGNWWCRHGYVRGAPEAGHAEPTGIKVIDWVAADIRVPL